MYHTSSRNIPKVSADVSWRRRIHVLIVPYKPIYTYCHKRETASEPSQHKFKCSFSAAKLAKNEEKRMQTFLYN